MELFTVVYALALISGAGCFSPPITSGESSSPPLEPALSVDKLFDGGYSDTARGGSCFFSALDGAVVTLRFQPVNIKQVWVLNAGDENSENLVGMEVEACDGETCTLCGAFESAGYSGEWRPMDCDYARADSVVMTAAADRPITVCEVFLLAADPVGEDDFQELPVDSVTEVVTEPAPTTTGATNQPTTTTDTAPATDLPATAPEDRVVISITCPVEEGACVTANDTNVTSGMTQLSASQYPDTEAQDQCLELCAGQEGATGCHVIWGEAEDAGCYVHTDPVDHGDGRVNNRCWVFANCYQEQIGGPTTVPPFIEQNGAPSTDPEEVFLEEATVPEQLATTDPLVETTAPVVETTAPVVVTTVPIVTTAPVVETTAPVVGTTAPVVQTTAPIVETTAPVVETTAPVVETTAPVVETTAPVVETTAPVVETTAPVVATTPPVVATTPPVVETTPPVVATTAPVVATTAPVVATTAPVVETTAPVVETTAPVVETTAPVVATTAPVVETTAPVVATTPAVVPTTVPARRDDQSRHNRRRGDQVKRFQRLMNERRDKDASNVQKKRFDGAHKNY